jgi:hypothetical protein
MKPEVVTRRIEAFHQRFGEPHLDFAYHAAFPLALTPDLLYRLWANFQRDRNGEVLKIPWLAVADLLLSSLCDEVGYELYEMETEVRNALLRELKVNPRFGEKRIHELSDFLLVYVKQQLESHDPDMRDFAQVQRWTALAYTKPGEAAREIASALNKLKLEEKAEWVRMASIVETFAEPLAGFAPLMTYTRGMASFVRGKTTKAVTELSQLAKAGDKLEVSGLNLSIPESLIKQIQENSQSTQYFGDRLGFGSVPEEPVQVQSPPIQKILILAANPKDTSRLRLDQELRDIDEGLQRSQKRDQFSLKQELAVRPRDIRRALLNFNPQIIHFSGHGTEEGLIFEDDDGNSHLVSGDALAALFKLFADRIECVVLNGCYSEIQAEAIAQHINYVIGMNQAIGDKAASAFAVGFYKALAANRSIEDAYQFGCVEIQLYNVSEHLKPVIYKKNIPVLKFDSLPEEKAQVQSPRLKKILILSANPTNTSKLRLDEEVREIEAGLMKRSRIRDKFEIISKRVVSPNDLRRALLDHQPEIVHFCGHGAGSQGLALENKSGQMQLVKTETLAGIFELFDYIECVLLNACYDEAQAEAIYQHVDCVIGMNRAIGDRAAIEFAVGFYDALAADRSYEDAYEFGRMNIDLEAIPKSSTPVLKTRKSHNRANSINVSVQSLALRRKILILSANPTNTNKLRLDEEVRAIQAGMERSKTRGQFEIIAEWAVRLDDLRRALLYHRPEILHFSGHGAENQGLALENKSGQMQLVKTETLARVFELFDYIECVLLNACYDEAQAEAIHQHVDYVIGMNQAIGNRAAIEFAIAFYDALGADRSYEDAYKFGCLNIDLEAIPESSTPVLKKRNPQNKANSIKT